VEGFVHGHHVLGFEINPYAALAARMKLEAAKLSIKEFERHIATFERYMEGHCPDDGGLLREPHSKPPVGFSGRTQLFSPKVQRRVLTVLDFIDQITNPQVRDLFRLALGSVMISVSNYSYEPSLTRRTAVDKPDIEDAPVAGIISSKLRLMLEDVNWLQRRLGQIGGIPQQRVVSGSFFSSAQVLRKSAFIDLVVTSPPYLNNYHYPRNTRPQLHWLGFASGSSYKGGGETESFGKFWQTVRDLPRLDLTFNFPSLQEVIERIRGVNADRGPYGGPGWANYVVTYFNDTHRFLKTLSPLLRPGAPCVVVLGNSIIQGVEVKTDLYFGRVAELCGLEFEDDILLRNKRTGSSIIQSTVRVDKAADRTVLYESAIVLRAPRSLGRKLGVPLRTSYARPATTWHVASKP